MGMPSRSHLCGHLARPGYLSFMSVGWASWKVHKGTEKAREISSQVLTQLPVSQGDPSVQTVSLLHL